MRIIVSVPPFDFVPGESPSCQARDRKEGREQPGRGKEERSNEGNMSPKYGGSQEVEGMEDFVALKPLLSSWACQDTAQPESATSACSFK
jgi:hypothetical protein